MAPQMQLPSLMLSSFICNVYTSRNLGQQLCLLSCTLWFGHCKASTFFGIASRVGSSEREVCKASMLIDKWTEEVPPV